MAARLRSDTNGIEIVMLNGAFAASFAAAQRYGQGCALPIAVLYPNPAQLFLVCRTCHEILFATTTARAIAVTNATITTTATTAPLDDNYYDYYEDNNYCYDLFSYVLDLVDY